eukprot:scaffold7.g3493.t1
MSHLPQVKLEQSDLGCMVSRPQSAKDVEVALTGGPAGAELSIGLKPRPLVLPLVPPVALYGGRVQEGQLGMRFMRVKVHPWDHAAKCVQLSISCPDTDALTLLRDRINQALLRCTAGGAAGAPAARPGGAKPGAGVAAPALSNRRPLAPRSLNTLSARPTPASSICGGGGAAASIWSGASGGGAATSHLSLGLSGRALASSADSRSSSAAGGGEDLAPLSAEQQQALELVQSGKSIFFTGCAGTGKSLLLRHILRALPCESTFVTGTTGLAACHLGGTTVNSYAGIGRGEGDLEALVRAASRGDALQRWRRTRALIVDELILSGDFHQLPPVAKGRDAAAARRFAFEAGAWARCVDACLLLNRTDLEFVEMLGRIRAGACPPATLRALLDACARPLPADDGILPTKLYTHRKDVDAVNAQELKALPTPGARFASQDAGPPDVLAAACPAKRQARRARGRRAARPSLRAPPRPSAPRRPRCPPAPSPAQLELKVGAQVMLIKNISHRQGLVNGARGVVERFSKSQQLPVVRFASGEVVTIGREKWTVSSGGRVVAQRVQVPLDLAWAMSVHKCQGMTLDRVEVSLDRAFEPGMAYVALSRALRADPKVVAFYGRLRERQLQELGLDPSKFRTLC